MRGVKSILFHKISRYRDRVLCFYRSAFQPLCHQKVYDLLRLLVSHADKSFWSGYYEDVKHICEALLGSIDRISGSSDVQ